MNMKKYNRPVVEISGFEVEDIIAVSVAFSGVEDADELQGVYSAFSGGDTSGASGETAVVFEW